MRSHGLSLNILTLLLSLRYVSATVFSELTAENSQCQVDSLNNTAICHYIETTCDTDLFFIARSFYCSKYHDSSAFAFTLSAFLIIGLAGLVVVLSLIVSNYLLISVTNFTELIGVSHNILSFLVIPLTNSVPDLFNFNLAMRTHSVDLVLGQVIGANLVTFTIVIGIISITSPFTIEDTKAVLGNFIWVSLSLILLTYIISDSKVTFLECLIMTSVLIFYLSFLAYQKTANENDFVDIEAIISHKGITANETTSLITSEVDVNETYESIEEPNYSTYSSHSNGLFIKSAEHFTNLVDFILFLLIPVTSITVMMARSSDETLSYKEKMFNLSYYHLWWITESIILMNWRLVGLSYRTIIFIVLGACVLVEYTRRYFTARTKNTLVDCLSVINALILISVVTGILIQTLKNLGAIWKMSEYSMGLVVFSIVNSINDIMMNVSLARNFRPILGLNSCLGTSLLITLVGIGTNGMLVLIGTGLKNGDILKESLTINLSSELRVSTIALNVIVLAYVVYIPLNGWRFDRRLGVLAIAFWASTICVCLVGNLG